jgi:glucose-6-phosphate 1-dehydrogenase
MNLFIFGSTGDLVKRKVLPALNKMNIPNLRIFAIGRKDFIDKMYLDFACKEECIIKDKIHYFKTNFGKRDICKECEKNLLKGEKNYFYISLPPDLLPIVFKKIKKIIDLGFSVEVLIEKPFGSSLNEAKKLSKTLKHYGINKHLTINDHYLFKEEILKLKKTGFREFEFYLLEKVGLEGRITYYDKSGALIDMIQSHMLNILFKLLHKEELKNVEIVSYNRKQYIGYKSELGKKSDTETFADVILKIKGKKIRLVTGKKFSKKESFINIDRKKIWIEEGEPYLKIFSHFFEGKMENFTNIENAIKAWEITEKIKQKKGKLGFYPKNMNFEDLEKNQGV